MYRKKKKSEYGVSNEGSQLRVQRNLLGGAERGLFGFGVSE